MVANFNPQPPKIDRAQALVHLRALGYQDGDIVYLRFFFPDGDPRKKQDKGRKLEGKLPNLPWKYMERLQTEGRGCYFVVNGGGHIDKDVRQGLAVFFEHDNLAKETSRDLWRTLELPEPTIQVDTGGKSIHSKWKLKEPCTPEQWRELQEDLLEYADGDRKLKNPSRVMRLAGAFHIKPGREPVQSTLILNTGKAYSYEDLRAIIPRRQKQEPQPNQVRWHEFDQSFQLPIDDLVPLYECLTRADRDLIDRGTGKGERNDRGYALAANLIATTDHLSGAGQRYEGNPRQLFEQFCQNCAPPIDSGEVETIWGSASKRTTTTSLPPDAIENCIKGWKWRQVSQQKQVAPKSNTEHDSLRGDRTHTGTGKGGSGDGNVVNYPAFNPLTTEDLTQALDRLIEQGLPQFQLEAAIPVVAKQSGYKDQVVWRLYRERLKEVEQAENRDDTLEQVRQLLEANEECLDISTILPDAIAKPVKQLAAWLNLRPECYLTALLATVSSLHDVGTYVTLFEKTDFVVTPNLFAAIVGESSQKKSPIFKAMVTKPLGVLRDAARLEHQQALLAYDQAMDQYNELKGKEKKEAFPDGPPKEPKLRIHSFTHTTGEGLLAQVNAHPNKGLLWETDELAGALKSANSYRQGRGSDEEDLLSFYDGTGATVLRAGGIRADLRGLLLSIIGTIQPAVLEKLAGDCNDINGKWARFAFVHQPLAACEILDDSGSLNLTPMLADLYQQIDKLPSVAYKLSPDAKRYFLDCRNKIDKKRVNDPNPAMRAVWGKTEGRIGKIAINLHVMWELLAGRAPSEFIPKDVIVAATRLAKLYANQIQSLYFQFASPDSSLPPNLAKVIELSSRKGWIKSKDVQLSINIKNRPSPDTVRGWFHELVAMGKGRSRGQGRSIEFLVDSVDPSRPQPVDPKVDLGRPKVDGRSTARSASVIEVQPKVDKVDLVDLNRSNVKPITAQTITDSVDHESTGSIGTTEVDLASTLSTCLPNAQNSDVVSTTAVVPPSTLGLLGSTLGSTEAPQLAKQPKRSAAAAQQVELNLNAESERSALGESVEVWHCGQWKPAVILQRPNNHSDPQHRLAGWKIRLAKGHELFVWRAEELRFLGGEP